MNWKQWQQENEIIMGIIPYAKDFPLINNYGWEWKYNNKTYNVRHVLNCYGGDVDYWTYTDCSKIGTPECSKQFNNFEETLEFLKQKVWEELEG